MGSKSVGFSFIPGVNEQIEAIVKLPEETRSIIHGVVKDHKNMEIQDAVVKLYELPDPEDPYRHISVAHTFTDACGQFLFGPLSPCKHYLINIWKNDIKIHEAHLNPGMEYRNDFADSASGKKAGHVTTGKILCCDDD